jgi:hypothetical protein
VKILSFGVTQHFTDEVKWILDLRLVSDSPRSMTIAVLTTLLVADM